MYAKCISTIHLKYSTIFRTITDESTGATKSIGLLGKSFSDLKKTISSIKVKGVINSIFNTSTIDRKAVIDYNNAIEKATASGATMAEKQKIMKSAMEDTNKATAQLIGSTKGAIVETDALTAAQKSSTIAAKAGQIALKGLSLAMNIGATVLLSLALNAIITGITDFVNKEKEALEAAKEVSKAYKDEKSSLETLKQEYFDIVDSSKTEAEKTQDLIEWKKKLVEAYGDEKDAIEGVTTARATGVQFFDKEAYENAKEYLVKAGEDYQKAVEKAFSAKTSQTYIYSGNTQAKNQLQDDLNQFGISLGAWYYGSDSDSRILLDYGGDIYKATDNIINALDYYNSKIAKGEELTNVQKTIKGILESTLTEYQTFIKDSEEILSSGGDANFTKYYFEFLKIDENKLDNVTAETFDDWKESFWQYINDNAETFLDDENFKNVANDYFDDLFTDLFPDDFDSNGTVQQGFNKITQSFKELKESLDSTFSDQSTIQSAFDKIQQGSSLSADEVRKLIGVCPELASAFTKTADGYTIDSERLVEANNKITSSSRQSLEEQLTSLKELKANLEEQLNTPIVYSNNRSYQDIREEYGKTQDELAKTEEAIAEVELSLSMLGIRNNSVINAFEKLDESFTNLTSKAKTLSSALQKQDEAGTLSADTIMNIVDAGYASALVFDQVTGKVTLNKEVYLQLAKAEYDEQIANLEMLRTFYETNDVLSNITSNTNGAIGSIYGIASAFLEVQKSISDTPEQIAEIDARIAALKTARDNVGNYGTTGDGTDSLRESFEAAMKEKEHLHNMGLISDKEYYKALEEANENHYKGILGKESEYNSNLEIIYNGRKNIYKEDVDNQVQALQEAYDKGFITAQELKSKFQQLAETKYGIGTIYYGTEFASENYDDLTGKAKDVGYDIYKEKLDELKKADDGSLESHQKFIEKWKKLAAKMFEGVDPKKYREVLDEIEKEDEDFLEDYQKKQEDAWNERVEKEKEYWENQKQAVVDYYDEEIKKLEDIADEEERINKQEELRLNLIKAQQDLLNAKKNRNQLVFANGGFEYAYDQEAVESASEAVKNAEKDIADYNRDQEINLLKEQKENEEKYYDQILKIIQFYIDKSVPLAESDKEVLDTILNSDYAKYATQETQVNPKAEILQSQKQTQSNESKDKGKNRLESKTEFKPDFSNLQRNIDYLTEIINSGSVEGMSKFAKFVGEPLMQAAQYPMWGQSLTPVYNNSTITNNNNDNKQITIGDIHVNVQGGTSDEMINEFSQKLSAALAECATREIYSRNKR